MTLDEFIMPDQQAEEKKIAKVEKTVSFITKRQHNSRPALDVTKFDVGSWTPEEIEQKTLDLYEKKDGVFSCLACDQTWPFVKICITIQT